MKRIALISGTRPEVIKLAPIHLKAGEDPDLEVLWISTGQHAQMAADMEKSFGIQPTRHLAAMTAGQTLGGLSASLIENCSAALRELQPDIAIVQGDTATALCGALAAYYLSIPIAHVEAGLRTHDLQSPWPEEGNRRMLGQIATLHFCPTDTSKRNLLSENVSEERCIVTGNTAIDALKYMHQKTSERLDSYFDEFRGLGVPAELLEDGPSRRKFILITVHRRESFSGTGLSEICRAVAHLAKAYPEVCFVYPVHLNPNVRKTVLPALSGHKNILLIEPLNYVQFLILMARCHLVMTDSGGVQEEAPSLGKPIIVLREKTERPEGVEAGASIICGTMVEKIVSEVSILLDDAHAYNRHVVAINPYGDGMASRRILDVVKGAT